MAFAAEFSFSGGIVAGDEARLVTEDAGIEDRADLPDHTPPLESVDAPDHLVPR